jgi:hypothetical protein
MEWKEKKDRPVKDLPLKLQFTVPDPLKVQADMGSKGGEVLTMKTEELPEALYVKDPDGYLIELVRSNGSTSYLSSVSIATSDLKKKLDWWSQTTQMTGGEIRKTKEGNTASLTGEWGAKLEFTELHEEPKRETNNLPYKIVVSVDKGKALFDRVKGNSGRIVTPLEVLNVSGFVEDPNDKSYIEVNTGSFGGPP